MTKIERLSIGGSQQLLQRHIALRHEQMLLAEQVPWTIASMATPLFYRCWPRC